MICIGGVCSNGIMPVNTTCIPDKKYFHGNCFNYSCNPNGICYNLCGALVNSDAALIGGVVGGVIGGLCLLAILAVIIFFAFGSVKGTEPFAFKTLGAGMANDNPLYAGDITRNNAIYEPSSQYIQLDD